MELPEHLKLQGNLVGVCGPLSVTLISCIFPLSLIVWELNSPGFKPLTPPSGMFVGIAAITTLFASSVFIWA